MAGLLGKRLAREIQKHPDIEITFGIVKNDETLRRLLYSPFKDDMTWVTKIPIYLDEGRRKVQEINELQQKIRFEPADQLNLRKTCDILLDTAAPGSRENWDERYRHFEKPVILQSGEYPHGRLISPPLIEETNQGNIYRQGGCIVSGLSPILAAIQQLVNRIRVNVLMQYDQKLNDYPTNQITKATYFGDDQVTAVEEELKSLLNTKEVKVDDLFKVPSLDYYTFSLHLEMKRPQSREKIREMLEQTPRIMIASESITSTYGIDHLYKEEALSLGRDIPPIVLYGCDLQDGHKEREIRIRAAIFSKMIAVLPNIDAIRILAKGMEPLEAMKMTDHYTGFDYLKKS